LPAFQSAKLRRMAASTAVASNLPTTYTKLRAAPKLRSWNARTWSSVYDCNCCSVGKMRP
jgi:hypothetical protein